MHVHIIANKLNLRGGGSNRSLYLLASALAEVGHAVTVHTLNFSHPNEVPTEVPFELRAHPSRGSTYSRIRQVRALLTEVRDTADIIHIFEPSIIPVAGLTNDAAGPPMVGRLNTYPLFCTNLARMRDGCWKRCTTARKLVHDDAHLSSRLAQLPLYPARTHIVPRAAGRLDRLIAVSPAVRDIHISNGVPADRITVIPSFADPEFTDGPSAFPVEGPIERLLYVGRLSPEKGVGSLIEALAQVDTPVQVDIVGSAHEVRFHGWVAYGDLESYYRRADVFVHPSVWPEPLGRTLFEAVQSGCYPVVSDVGGPPWIVGDHRLCFPPGDPAALAQLLTALRDDRDLRASLARRIKHRFDDFSKARNVQRMTALYTTVSS
jgi:glycosyltransferase involved in cell wall biosynthesis